MTTQDPSPPSPKPPIAAAPPPVRTSPLSTLGALFDHTIIQPVVDFLKKPINLGYSLGYFLLRPGSFAMLLESALKAEEVGSRRSRWGIVLGYKELAVLFAWTWLSISAIGTFFGGINTAINITQWPLLGSLLTGLAYQLLYFFCVALLWGLIKTAGGSRVPSNRATTYAAYYAFVLSFPVMVITLVFLVVNKISGPFSQLLEAVAPESGRAYPGSWGMELGVILAAGWIALEVLEKFKYYILAFYAAVFCITFIHPCYLLHRVYSVRIWRFALTYLVFLIGYFVVMFSLAEIMNSFLLYAMGFIPLLPLIYIDDF